MSSDRTHELSNMIDTFTMSVLLMLLVALWMYKARQAYTAFRVADDQSRRTQPQAPCSAEIEAEVEQLTDQYNRRSWQKLIMSCAGLALISFAAAFLSRFLDSSGPKTSDLSSSIFIPTAVLSSYVLKAHFPADKISDLTSYDLRASLTALLHLILRIILFGVIFNLFITIYDTVRYGYLKSVRAVERPSQITKADVGVDFYLINTHQSSPSGATLYDYNRYRGLEVTALYPLYDTEGHDGVYLTKGYTVLNSDRPPAQINQDILNDLSTYTHHKVCLSLVPEYRAPSGVDEIFKMPNIRRSHENTVILEPTHKGRRGLLDDQAAPTPNARQQDTSACGEITAQESITHLFQLIILGALIVWLFQQTLMCRKIVLAYLKYRES